jgi:predicted Zn-dependent peptidase
MKRMWMISLVLALTLVQIPSWADYKTINEGLAGDPLSAQIFQLDNGLTVYLTENHETPRFYTEIAVRAGSKHDPATHTGLAHYLEHLLFKGNQDMGTTNYAKEKVYLDRIVELYEQHSKESDPEKRAAIYTEINKAAQRGADYSIPNEIDKLYKIMGGTAVNAHTWHEETVYKVNLPSNRMEQWAAIESQRYVNPVFRLFHTELETVYEEKNRSLDNKDRVSYYAMAKAMYKKHPYGQQPTIGTVEHLKNPSLKVIQEYFETYYVPNNMAIFISGDINIPETISIIDEYFSFWKSKPVPEVGPWKEKAIKGVERVQVNYQGEEYVELGFRTAPNHHEDSEALTVLDMILDNSQAGLININLNQQQKVRRAGSYPLVNNDYGSQHLYGIPKEGQSLEDVEKLLLEQIALLKAGDFEDWIIPAIITDFKKNQKAGLESNQDRVDTMRRSFLTFEEWGRAVKHLDRISQVTKDDIVRVANRYFNDDYVVVQRIDEQHEVPPVEKPIIEPLNIDPSRQSKFAADLLGMPYSNIEPTYVNREKDLEIIDLVDGVQLYYSSNPLNDLFSFTIGVEFGTQEDKKISFASQLMDKSGTAKFSSEDLKKEWYKLGSTFGFGAGDNSSSFSITGMDENFEKTLALMFDVIQNPVADAETLEQLKAITLKSREDVKKDAGALSLAVGRYNRYGKESSFLRMLSTEEVKALTVGELHAAIKDLLNYKHTITYTGSLSLEEVVAILKKHHAVKGSLKETPAYRYEYARKISKNEIYFFHKEMAQAQIRFEFPDGVFNEAEAIPNSLYNNYFAGGMSGIVFQELREARALAYSAGARYIPGGRTNAENLILGVIGCQADKSIESVEAFLDLFDNLPESPERYAQAAGSIANRYRTTKIGFRSVIGAVRGWERLGLEGDPRQRRFEELKEANLDDLMSFHAEHIKGKPKLISIIGDKNKIDMEALAQFGTIKEVSLDDIFVK